MADTTHHFSDVDTWKHPDRNFFVFMVISVLFGFLGMDHFYLRSFATGTQKFLLNLFTFGLWYWWDLIQIVKDGSKVRKDGLNSPFDWVRGIGRGVFTPLNRAPGDPLYVSKKSYLVYAFLAIFFGWLGADKFYIGEFLQGCAKLFSCFNIFIFLFGWLWVLWDSFHAFFMMDSVLKNGISAPIPYSMLFPEASRGDMFLVNHLYDKSEDATGVMDWIAKTFNFPSVPVFPWRAMYRELVVPFMTPPLIKAVEGVKATPCGGEMGAASPQMPSLASALPQMPSLASALPTPPSLAAALPTPPSLAAALPTPPSLAAALPTPPSLAAALPTPPSVAAALPTVATAPPAQKGGGESGSGPGPVIAGTLTALVLAGGLKGFYDVISKQYG